MSLQATRVTTERLDQLSRHVEQGVLTPRPVASFHLERSSIGDATGGAGCVHILLGVLPSFAWRRSRNLAGPSLAHAVHDAVRNAFRLGLESGSRPFSLDDGADAARSRRHRAGQ